MCRNRYEQNKIYSTFLPPASMNNGATPTCSCSASRACSATCNKLTYQGQRGRSECLHQGWDPSWTTRSHSVGETLQNTGHCITSHHNSKWLESHSKQLTQRPCKGQSVSPYEQCSVYLWPIVSSCLCVSVYQIRNVYLHPRRSCTIWRNKLTELHDVRWQWTGCLKFKIKVDALHNTLTHF